MVVAEQFVTLELQVQEYTTCKRSYDMSYNQALFISRSFIGFRIVIGEEQVILLFTILIFELLIEILRLPLSKLLGNLKFRANFFTHLLIL